MNEARSFLEKSVRDFDAHMTRLEAQAEDPVLGSWARGAIRSLQIGRDRLAEALKLLDPPSPTQ